MQQNLSIKVALAAIDKMTQPLNAARKASQGLASAVKSTQGQIKALQSQAKKFDAASAAVSKTAKAIQAAREQSVKLRQEFGRASERTDEQKAALAALSSQTGQLTRTYQAEMASLNKVRAGFYRLGVSVREGQSATEQITERTRQYNDQLSKQEARLKRVTQAQASYDKAKKLQGRLASVGLKAGAAGGAMLWGTMRAMRPGMDFDQAYSQTLAVAQLSRSSQEGLALREQAKMLSRTTHFSALQATQGQTQLISGGMTAANARQALPGMMNLALAAHTDLGAAASAGSNVLDHFQLQASQMGHVSDVLVGTFTRSKTSLESLDETLEYVGTVANNAGVSLETTAAAAAMLAKNGLKGSIAGTGLKETLTGLYAPSSEGAKALNALHIGTKTATGAIRPLADVLSDLWKKTRQFDQGSQLDIFKTLFGQQGMQAGQVLARSAAEGNLQAFNDYLIKLRGVAAGTSRTMTDNFDGDMQMLHSAWDGLWTQMEEGADAPLRKTVQWITQMLQGITTWAQSHPALTRAIMGTVLAMGALLLVGGTLLTTLAGLLGPLAALRLSVSLLAGGEGLGMLTGAVARFGGVLSGVVRTASIELAGLVTALGWPVTLAIGAIVGIGAAIWHWWNPIQTWFSGLISRLEETAKTGSWLKSQMAQFALDIINAFKPLADFFEYLDNKIGAIISKSKGFLQKHGWMDPDKPAFDASKMQLPADLSFPPVPGGGGSRGTSPAPEFGSIHWSPPGKNKDAGAGASAASNSINRLGDIVFKTLPSWVPLSGGFTQPRIVAGAGASGSRLTAGAPKSAPVIGTNVAGDINLHIHIDGVEHMDQRQLATEIKHQVMGELNRLNRQKLSSLKDTD